MPDPRELLHSNLHEVFSERHPERRWTAIDRTYTEDVRFIDPEGTFVGRQALNDQAQKLLDGAMKDSVLEEDGPRYVYLPVKSSERAREDALKHVVHTFFEGSTEQAVTALLRISDAELSDAEVARLQDRIRKARLSGR